MPARNLIILFLSAVISLLCYHTASRNHYGGLLATAIGEINETFVRPVDDRDLFEGAMDGMVRQLDPYSDYIDPDELAEFKEDLDQKFGGIGILVEVNSKTNRLTVLSPLPDTPASEAGMRAGDQILAIDGKSTEGFQIRDAVDLMRGDPGTSLLVTVLHAGDSESVDMELERAIIPIASVRGDVRNADGTWQFRLEDHPRIGLVRLATFGEKTAQEIRDTIRKLEGKIDGLILDVRGNGGGLLNSAIDVCNLFVDEGGIVSIRGRLESEYRDYYADPSSTVMRDLPLVVLIDGFSASASEITAGCLQDHGRAVVVGTRSWGKGTVQNVMPFEGGKSALKLTVATYWRPSGNNIHRHVDATDEDAWGVTPDEGCLVETDELTFTKIFLLRRKRDRVTTDEEVTDVEESGSDQVTEEVVGENESDTDTEDDKESKLPDITGFEDPQMKRAVEVIKELISGERKPGKSIKPEPAMQKAA